MSAQQFPASPSSSTPPALPLSPNNPLGSFSHIRPDPFLLACSEQETLKLGRLNTELVEHNKEMADRAEWLWDEMHREKAEKLATRLHSKKPGPVASGLRLTAQGTKLLLREFMAIQKMVQNRRDCLMGVDREEALNLLGVSFNCRLLVWDMDALPDEMRAEQRVALWNTWIDESMAALQEKLPHLQRIETGQRQRIMSGQPAPDDKIANRLQREINASERRLFRFWTEAKKLEKQQGFKTGTPALEHSDYEANPISAVESGADSHPLPDCETNPIADVTPVTTPNDETKPISGEDHVKGPVSVANCGTNPNSVSSLRNAPILRPTSEANPIVAARPTTRTGKPGPDAFVINPPNGPGSSTAKSVTTRTEAESALSKKSTSS